MPLLRGSSKVPLNVYYAYFLDWQGLSDIAWTISGYILPGQYPAIFGQGNTCNARNKLPVTMFLSREMLVMHAKYTPNVTTIIIQCS